MSCNDFKGAPRGGRPYLLEHGAFWNVRNLTDTTRRSNSSLRRDTFAIDRPPRFVKGNVEPRSMTEGGGRLKGGVQRTDTKNWSRFCVVDA